MTIKLILVKEVMFIACKKFVSKVKSTPTKRIANAPLTVNLMKYSLDKSILSGFSKSAMCNSSFDVENFKGGIIMLTKKNLKKLLNLNFTEISNKTHSVGEYDFNQIS